MERRFYKMPWPLIPWSTCSIPEELQNELIRRRKNISFNYKKIDGWNPENGDWQKDKGPMTAWVRVCSNGSGRPELKKPGFVLSGGKSFYQTYGFKWNQNGNQQVLGYTPDGKPHTLEYDKNTSQFPIHVPSPEIARVETIIQKELFRRAWIHWTCFSAKQLEYMTPYFLIPGITVILEFGWNHYNPQSLIDLTNEDKLADYFFKNPYPLYNENILKSNGNYDVVFGKVTNYEWSIEGNKINCMTEVTSLDRLYAGVPISAILATKETNDKDTNISYLPNLKTMCDANFIKNIKAISTCKSLDDIEKTNGLSNNALFNLIKNGTVPGKIQMKEEYWRGVFYGRDGELIKKSKTGLDFEWSVKGPDDFKEDDENVWVNMGFLVELMNRSLALHAATKDAQLFFEVDVDNAVIGAHPNLISTDGSVLLIPNSTAPKYMWGYYGQEQHDADLKKPKSDYNNQFLVGRTNPSRKPLSNVEDKNDIFWHANHQLRKTCYQPQEDIERDDLDVVINAIRYLYTAGTREFFSFPFSTTEEVEIKNRDTIAKYDPYFYGYFKDLYFNIKKFVSLVNSDSVKTYVDLYKAIFSEINKAGGNFWELELVENDNTAKMIVVDKKMLPSGNNRSKPWYFDYYDADQLMTSLSFKPKMSDAQAFRVVFGDVNNTEAMTTIKEENDLLDYQFNDRILSKKDDKAPTISVKKETNPFLDQIKNLQNQTATPEMYQFTIKVNDKPYFRRLVMPDSDILNCLIDDHDLERNQRYTGIQPITVEVGLQGIGGLRTFMTFLIRNLPNPYHHKDVCYRIVDVRHTLQDGKWDTIVKAGIIPLRGYIKQKIGITE